MNDDKDLVFAGGYALVPEGHYEAAVIRWNRCEYFGQRKMYLWFRIITGPYQGTMLFMTFNINPPFTKSSKYFKAWRLSNGGEIPARNSRMSPRIFQGKAFKIKVRTVKKGKDMKDLPQDDMYSVVEEIIEVCTGKPDISP